MELTGIAYKYWIIDREQVGLTRGGSPQRHVNPERAAQSREHPSSVGPGPISSRQVGQILEVS